MGKLVEARKILGEVEQVSKAPYFPRALWCAKIHALLAERDQAFAWLDRAWEAREPPLIYLRQGPGFERLHDDPRFAIFCAASVSQHKVKTERKGAPVASEVSFCVGKLKFDFAKPL
jgi:hypothetical protein